MVGVANIGGVRVGLRTIAPHIGGFIGPYPTAGTAAPIPTGVAVHLAKQPPYRIRVMIRRIAGLQPALPPISANLVAFASQPVYRVKRYVLPWGGPYPQGGTPPSRNLLVRAKQPRYPFRAYYRPWIGPYPRLGSVSRNALIRAKQPPYVTHPRHGVPIVGVALQPPLGQAFSIRAKQPRYVVKPRFQPWIGPYPRLGSLSRNRLVQARYPRYPTIRRYDARWAFRVPHPIHLVLFRRTLSQEGTRTGARQDEPWGPNMPHTYASMLFDTFVLDWSGLS